MERTQTADFFFKNLNMIVTQKSGKHGKKRKLQSNLAHEY